MLQLQHGFGELGALHPVHRSGEKGGAFGIGHNRKRRQTTDTKEGKRGPIQMGGEQLCVQISEMEFRVGPVAQRKMGLVLS